MQIRDLRSAGMQYRQIKDALGLTVCTSHLSVVSRGLKWKIL
jgi:hypothetical protein